MFVWSVWFVTFFFDKNFKANLVLESTVERIVVKDLFADLPLGLYIVRGENVLLMAEIVRCVRAIK